MFSKAVLATNKKIPKLNWFEYYIQHCWMTGWQTIRISFRNWKDLMTGDYSGYALMWYDDPYEECYNTFWSYLGDDDVLPKEFLESLMKMAEDLETGKVKTVPFTQDMFDNVEDLVGDLIDDDVVEEE
jgi:hypothetical protein